MYRDRDFDLERASAANENVLTNDLELDTLFTTMAAKDPLVLQVSKKAILMATANDLATIYYRQGALKDCISNADIVRQLYGLAIEFLRATEKDMVDVSGIPLRPARHFGPTDGRFH